MHSVPLPQGLGSCSHSSMSMHWPLGPASKPRGQFLLREPICTFGVVVSGITRLMVVALVVDGPALGADLVGSGLVIGFVVVVDGR